MLQRNINAASHNDLAGMPIGFRLTKGTIMRKTVLFPLLIALATPAFAADEPVERSFTRNGQTYTYTTRKEGDLTILEGRNVTAGEPFRLTVRNGWVEGKYDGKPVSFVSPDKSNGTVLVAR